MPKPVFSNLNHIGIVTSDIDRAVRTWWDRYGIGPWSLYTKDPSNMTVAVDGEHTEFAMRVAVARISPTSRIEIIQPLDDRSPYAKSLARHGGADHIHHVQFDVNNYQESANQLENELNLSKLLHATFDGVTGSNKAFTGTYFDTERDLGFIAEIGHAPEDFKMPEPDALYPHK